MVLLAAIEFNREDEEKVSVEETERKPLNAIHSADEKKEGKIVTNEKLGTNQLERNVEAAWTNRSKSTVEKEQTCCVSWYNIFRFLGKTKT